MTAVAIPLLRIKASFLTKVCCVGVWVTTTERRLRAGRQRSLDECRVHGRFFRVRRDFFRDFFEYVEIFFKYTKDFLEYTRFFEYKRYFQSSNIINVLLSSSHYRFTYQCLRIVVYRKLELQRLGASVHCIEIIRVPTNAVGLVKLFKCILPFRSRRIQRSSPQIELPYSSLVLNKCGFHEMVFVCSKISVRHRYVEKFSENDISKDYACKDVILLAENSGDLAIHFHVHKCPNKGSLLETQRVPMRH
jgi:hypothetical protein